MDFYTQNGRKRPVRLSSETRLFAYESLNRKYGVCELKRKAEEAYEKYKEGEKADSGKAEWIPTEEQIAEAKRLMLCL